MKMSVEHHHQPHCVLCYRMRRVLRYTDNLNVMMFCSNEINLVEASASEAHQLDAMVCQFLKAVRIKCVVDKTTDSRRSFCKTCRVGAECILEPMSMKMRSIRSLGYCG